MKRVLPIILSLVLMFTFVSCKTDKNTADLQGVDVEYYANLGKIPECEYTLGSSAEDLIENLKQKQNNAENSENPDEEGDGYYQEMKSGDYNMIMTASFSYFYKKDGITHIVSYDKSYGYDIGTISIEIKKEMSARGFETAERDLTDDEKPFILGSSDCSCLEYRFKDNTVLFVFQDNSLCATVLHK